MKKILTKLIPLLALFAALPSTKVAAQDIHFTQFYMMPVLLNPSLTGHISGSYRINAIYRNQWSSITSGGVYATPGLSFDMNFMQKNSKNSFGGGIALAHDRSGGGDLQTSMILLSGAYHLSLGQSEKNFLSIGLQGGILDKRLDEGNLTFPDQIDPITGEVIGTTQTKFENTSINNFDLKAGATFSSYPSAKFNYMLGAAFMHLTKPEESFLGDAANKLPNRLALHGQATIKLDEHFNLRPHVLYMTQADASELNLGLNFGYQSNERLGLWVGAGYRNEGAVLFMGGFGYKGLSIGVAYDNDISDLNSKGAYEIALGYVGNILRPVDPILPAIRLY
jgi:type IX secretion system PorP/SprF family membrane protein